MRHHYRLFIAALIVSIAFAFTRTYHDPKPVAKGFALIELYTSEGCSSCPSADKLVAKIAEEYKGKEVYVLAYHVDYWNRLGWKDVFSSPQYSARQKEYSRYLNLDGVYTPQAIVNGRTEFVGSEESKMRSAIQASLSKVSSVKLITLNCRGVDEKTVNIKYFIPGVGTDNSLLLALIQKHAQTNVKAGENNGKILSHINVVRQLEAIKLNKESGLVEINIPNGLKNEIWDIVGFVQNNKTGEIIAAKQMTFDNKEIVAIAKHQ